MFVNIAVAPGACQISGPGLDGGATYAIDTRAWRILAVKR